MKVQIRTICPPKLRKFLELRIEVKTKYSIIDEEDNLDKTIETDSDFIRAGVYLGEIELASYKGKPKEQITIKIPEKKTKLLLELL